MMPSSGAGLPSTYYHAASKFAIVEIDEKITTNLWPMDLYRIYVNAVPPVNDHSLIPDIIAHIRICPAPL